LPGPDPDPHGSRGDRLGTLGRLPSPHYQSARLRQGGACPPFLSPYVTDQLSHLGLQAYLCAWSVRYNESTGAGGVPTATRSMTTIYRVKWMGPASMAWRVVKFNRLASATALRSVLERDGILAVLMPPVQEPS
jgi:hypothetical protein